MGLIEGGRHRALGRKRSLPVAEQYRHRAASFHQATMDFLHGIPSASYLALLLERLH